MLTRLHPAIRAALVPSALLVLGVLVVTAGPAGQSPDLPLQIMATSAASVVLLVGLVGRGLANEDRLDGGRSDGFATQVLGWGPLVWLGTVSYGFYLYHLPIMVVPARYGPASWALRTVMALALALALSAASYEFVEKPFLRLKNRLA